MFDTLRGVSMDVVPHGSMCRTKMERHNVISFGISTRHGFAMSRSKMGSKSCDTLLQRLHLPNPDSKILLFACFLIYVSDVHFSSRNSPFEILKDSVCTVSAPVVKQMALMDKAQIHVFADYVLCLGDSAMNESMEKFTKTMCVVF